MATTAVSSTSSTAAATAATNKANAQKIMTSLGAGSGVDVASLAQSLVNAEKLPKETELNTKITKNEARVSGYSAVMFMMTELKTAFTAMKDRNNFNALAASNSNPSAFNVTTSSTAVTGNHDVEVLRLAKSQRTVSSGLSAATASLNGGKAMTLSLQVGDASAVTRSVTTRQGVTAATESAVVNFKDLAAGEDVEVSRPEVHGHSADHCCRAGRSICRPTWRLPTGPSQVVCRASRPLLRPPVQLWPSPVLQRTAM